jgi:hypothetical protein
LALKAHLTSQYFEASLRVYRELRQAARDALVEVKEAGYGVVHLEGNDEAAEIFRLTCLEQGMKAVSRPADRAPTVRVEGVEFSVR